MGLLPLGIFESTQQADNAEVEAAVDDTDMVDGVVCNVGGLFDGNNVDSKGGDMMRRGWSRLKDLGYKRKVEVIIMLEETAEEVEDFETVEKKEQDAHRERKDWIGTSTAPSVLDLHTNIRIISMVQPYSFTKIYASY